MKMTIKSFPDNISPDICRILLNFLTAVKFSDIFRFPGQSIALSRHQGRSYIGMFCSMFGQTWNSQKGATGQSTGQRMSDNSATFSGLWGSIYGMLQPLQVHLVHCDQTARLQSLPCAGRESGITLQIMTSVYLCHRSISPATVAISAVVEFLL